MGEQVKQPEIRYGYTNALSMEQTDADGTRYPWRIAIAADVEAALASARAEVEALKRTIVRLECWTHEMGANLCPGGRADSFGEGVREMKAQVARILSQAAREPGRSGA